MTQIVILACASVGLYPGNAERAAAEPLVLNVWPGDAVGDHGQIGPERVRAAAEAPTKDAKWITNVTRPTISVFRPEARNNARVAVVICPGGGYWNLAWDKEGEEVAAWLNTLGITGVVLKYRVPRRPGEPEPLPAPGPLLDAQRAIRLVRSRAGEWGIDPERIGIVGFSAGGHLAVMTAISFEKPAYGPIDDIDRASCRPNFAVVAYPGYILTRPGSGVLAESIRIPKGTGPMFLVHASDDDERGAQPEQSLALYGALRGAGVPVELHIYDEGGHGFGVRRSQRPVSRWTERCAEWLRRRDILPAEAGRPSRAGLDVQPEGNRGLAARHPGEQCVGDDSAMSRHDDLETDEPPDRPETAYHRPNIPPAGEPQDVHRATRTLATSYIGPRTENDLARIGGRSAWPEILPPALYTRQSIAA